MQDLEGKTAVVTGAASGMGYAFSAAFAGVGMNVVMADVEEDTLKTAAAAPKPSPSVPMTAVV